MCRDCSLFQAGQQLPSSRAPHHRGASVLISPPVLQTAPRRPHTHTFSAHAQPQVGPPLLPHPWMMTPTVRLMDELFLLRLNLRRSPTWVSEEGGEGGAGFYCRPDSKLVIGLRMDQTGLLSTVTLSHAMVFAGDGANKRRWIRSVWSRWYEIQIQCQFVLKSKKKSCFPLTMIWLAVTPIWLWMMSYRLYFYPSFLTSYYSVYIMSATDRALPAAVQMEPHQTFSLDSKRPP